MVYRDTPGSRDAEPDPAEVEACVAERLLMDENLEESVRRRLAIRFSHGGKYHEVEPHAYGVQADGYAVLLGYETALGAGGGSLQEWKTFRLAGISDLSVTNRPWGRGRPPPDSPLSVTFARSEDIAPEPADSDILEAPPEAVAVLRVQVEEAVEVLRDQVFELCRLEAYRAHLERELERLTKSEELALELGVLTGRQAQARQQLIDLIPKVAELQRRLPPLR